MAELMFSASRGAPRRAPSLGSGAARRLAAWTALGCAVLLVPAALAQALDPRALDGVSVWVKPIKFALAFALHWATIAWVMQHLHRRGQARALPWLRAGAAATAVELTVIVVQAARGRASHFNTSTPLDAFLYYGLMGTAVLVMIAATLAVALLLWRHPAAGRPGAAWHGAWLGLGLGSVLTLAVTAPLAAGLIDGPGPWVGGVKSSAHGLPWLHWSTTGGDLRVPHFMATHLMQALPLLGWALERARARRAAAGVWAGAVAGMALVAATWLQAVEGRPFWGG